MTEHDRIRPPTEELREALEEEMSRTRFGRWALKQPGAIDLSVAQLEKGIAEVRVAREPDGTLRISTPGPHWAMALFAAAFLGFAAFFLVASLVSDPQLFNISVALVLLLFGGFIFFRLLAGETFTVDHSRVTLRSAVGPLGRTRRIPIHEIERVVAATETDEETQSRITIFSTSGRSYACGWVSEYEAAEIVKLIETRLQQLR